METNNTYKEIKSWFESNRDLKLGMKLHAKYSKNTKNIKKLAVTKINRKQLLETYLQEILNNCKPSSEKKFTQNKDEKSTQRVVKQTFQQRLEEEFPKLKFSDLPDKLKLLVFKRFEAWEKSKELHNAQQEAETNEERFEAAKQTVQSIMENWTIWEELDNYQKFGEILGKHPDFEKNEFEEWIAEMEKKSALEYTKEFNKVRKNARNNINRLLKKSEEKPLTEKQQEIIDMWIYKHDLVSQKLLEPLFNC